MPPAHLDIEGITDLEPIGQGGFATVYRGWQADFHRHVAVKVLDPAPHITGRFQREVRAMGAVSDHPNVVPVYDAGTIGDRPYLVMPLLPGGTLEDEMRHGPLAPEEVARIGRAMADALRAAHGAGLLHRDVKPANILMTGYGVPQLADFGIARFADATLTQGTVLATVAYAAPEVLSGEPASPRSDIYSLGATLHAALVGRPPFAAAPGEAAVSVGVKVMTQEPSDLRAHGVPAALAAVIQRAMEKEPADRYPSAEAMRDALDPAFDVPTETRPAVPLAATVQIDRAPVTAGPPAPAGSARRSPRSVAVAIVLIAAAWAAVLLVTRDRGDSGGTPTPRAASVTTTTPGQKSASIASETSGDVEAAATSYYRLLDRGDISSGFARLSESYQQRTGRTSYDGFWRSIASVEVVNVEGSGNTARVTLRYTRNDGTTSTERATLRFVEGPGGRLLVDDYRLG